MSSPKFANGDLVRRRNNPDAVGQVANAHWDDAAEEWTYEVRFGSGIRGVPEVELEVMPSDADPWEELAAGRVAGAAALKALLTYERLRRPPSRLASSFGSAKAAFYPYQFKPLLKFLENPKQRLLLADDVGLGKTIEAGYVLREIRARHGLDRALIVVPARLKRKWRDELERRFDEKFEIVRGEELKKLLARLRRGGEIEGFKWIVSYESARAEHITEGLAELRPQIDLVIFDEAHRMRNPSTLQHKLGRALSEAADAMLLLTATPVQTGLENLFWLLHVLDPEEFASEVVFKDQLEANRPIVRALRALQVQPVDGRAVASHLEELGRNPFTQALTSGKYFESILDRARSAQQLRRAEIVELQRDVSELSLTGHILSRTRKIDAMPDRPPRKPQSVSVRLQESERRFYERVGDLYAMARPDLGNWGLAMAALEVFRYTASSIPAAVEFFRERLGAGVAVLGPAETDDPDEETDASFADGADEKLRENLARRLASIVEELAPPPGVDSKYDQLWEALETIWTEDRQSVRPDRKVVVFSRYPRTLKYLAKRLRADGVESHLMYGETPLEDRETIVEEFASQPKVRILLSSEVGGEGIDLQFASVVVNYDLPWNPMVVEQRIGRLDRIGQDQPIVILNLFAESTIEDRILRRLYDRILVAVDTIGDIDPVLGQRIEKLARQALSGELSESDQAEQARQTADAIVREEESARRLAADADALLASDQSFLDEIQHLIGERRIPVGAELRQYLEDFAKRHYAGARIPAALGTDVGPLALPPQLAMDMRSVFTSDPEAQRTSRKIEMGPFEATFDQKVAVKHPRAELIYARHPLIKFALEKQKLDGPFAHRSFAIVLQSTDLKVGLRHGAYGFAVYSFEVKGVRARTELVPLAVNSDGEVVNRETAQKLLEALLDSAQDREQVMDGVSPNVVMQMAETLVAEATKRRGEMQVRERELNAARIERRRATLEATLTARMEAAQRRLSSLEERGAAEFAVRMARARLERARTERELTLRELVAKEETTIETEQVAVGIVVVE
jgi:superfamily II DNA or RNA helicase